MPPNPASVPLSWLIIWKLRQILGYVFWFLNRLGSLPECFYCMLFQSKKRKYLHVVPFIVLDAHFAPVIEEEKVIQQLAFAADLLAKAHVTLKHAPIRNLGPHLAGFQATSCAWRSVFTRDRALLASLNTAEKESQLWFAGQSLFGARPPYIKVVYCPFENPGQLGCYYPPDDVVLVSPTAKSDTLAHELGHAGDLWHSSNPDNLMRVPDRKGSQLTRGQVALLRTSRFVTFRQ
jgi:hypothetical protein